MGGLLQRSLRSFQYGGWQACLRTAAATAWVSPSPYPRCAKSLRLPPNVQSLLSRQCLSGPSFNTIASTCGSSNGSPGRGQQARVFSSTMASTVGVGVSNIPDLSDITLSELAKDSVSVVWGELLELSRQPGMCDLGQGFPDYAGSSVARSAAAEAMTNPDMVCASTFLQSVCFSLHIPVRLYFVLWF